jgi:hypothetical protein
MNVYNDYKSTAAWLYQLGCATALEASQIISKEMSWDKVCDILDKRYVKTTEEFLVLYDHYHPKKIHSCSTTTDCDKVEYKSTILFD